MTKLSITFRDSIGETARVIDQDKFTVGRSEDNDLTIPNKMISKTHLSIERVSDVFVICDCNSSNGTTINGTNLLEPQIVKNGDVVNLGNAFDIKFEFVPELNQTDQNISDSAFSISKGNAFAEQRNDIAKGKSSFILFPLMPIASLFLVIAGFVVFGSVRDKTNSVKQNEPVVGDAKSVKKPIRNDSDDLLVDNSENTNGQTNAQSQVSNVANPIITTRSSSELDKVERNAYLFMRKIATNDSNPVLTLPQLQILAGKIRELKSASSLRENLTSVIRNKSKIETLAKERNLTPAFLGIIAIAKPENKTVDIVSTAAKMRETLNDLRGSIGNALADDSLLMIAAYDEAVMGRKHEMRDRLARLTKDSGVSVRQIRTVWYLKEIGQINNAQFDFAIRFLAIGTISENPREFGFDVDKVGL